MKMKDLLEETKIKENEKSNKNRDISRPQLTEDLMLDPDGKPYEAGILHSTSGIDAVPMSHQAMRDLDRLDHEVLEHEHEASREKDSSIIDPLPQDLKMDEKKESEKSLESDISPIQPDTSKYGAIQTGGQVYDENSTDYDPIMDTRETPVVIKEEPSATHTDTDGTMLIGKKVNEIGVVTHLVTEDGVYTHQEIEDAITNGERFYIMNEGKYIPLEVFVGEDFQKHIITNADDNKDSHFNKNPFDILKTS